MYFIMIFLVLRVVIGLDNISVKFSMDYFKHKHLKQLCSFVCSEADMKSLHTSATKNNVISSSVNIKDNFNFNKTQTCLQRYSTNLGVLLDLSCNKYEDVLNFASENTMFDDNHKWLLIDETELDENQYTKFNLRNSDNYHSNCTETNEANGKYRSYFHTIINETDHNIFKISNRLYLSVDADFVVASRKGFLLLDVFNFGKIQGGDVIVNYLQQWTSNKGFSESLNDYKYYKRWNFQQWAMRMVVVMRTPPPNNLIPSLMTHETLSQDNPDPSKIPINILNVIAEIHNFRYNYSVLDRWIGEFKRNATKVVANSLYFREQDISPIIRSLKHVKKHIDLLHPPLTNIETRYYYRIPTTGVGKYENQFLRPLTSESWTCVAAMSVLCAVMLVVAAWLERRPLPVQFAVFSVIASICQQCFEDNFETEIHRERVSTTRKLTMLVTGLACVLLFNYYTSSVVSWLLSGPPPSINSLQELLDSPLELIFEDIGYTRSWLQSVEIGPEQYLNDPVYSAQENNLPSEARKSPTYYFNIKNAKIEDELRQKKVFKKKKGTPLLKPVKEGIQMVKDGGYAYHTEVATANALISRLFTHQELCSLGSLQSMEKTLLYACVQKNSPYKEFFVWSLSRLSERGVITCVQRRLRVSEVGCMKSEPRALALGGAAPAFVLLFAGYLLAVIIMIIERLVYWKKNEK